MAIKTTTATEDITIHVGSAPSTNLGGFARYQLIISSRARGDCAADGYLGISLHVTVLSTTEDRAIDPTTGDGDEGIPHIGVVV